ncbi:hypothetical protein B0H14DRAFT_3619750 [Mycena olivaceomarginata]|nr:hypothetical protein B0H14DRAFT_3619750 [Mycena olivaceomarginata]
MSSNASAPVAEYLALVARKKITPLEQQLVEATVKLASPSGQLVTLCRELEASAHHSIKQLEAQHAADAQRLGEQLEGARDEVAGLREELAASSRELSQRRAQSQAELKRVRAASVAEIRDLRDNYDKSRAELYVARKELEWVRAEAMEVHQELLTARRDWAQGRREADAALFEVRQTAQAELLGVRQALAAAEAQLQSALQDVEQVRDKLTQERIALEKQLAQAVNEGCEVQAELHVARKELERVRAEAAEVHQELLTTRRDWEQGRREADAALFEVRQTAQAELLGVRQALAAAEAQLQSALQDVELVRDKWTQERIADAPKTAENVDQLEKQLAQAVNEGCEVLERLRLETDDTAARNSQMSQMLESAKRELESQKVERDAAVAARSQLNEELLQLQSRLDALELVPLPTAVPNDEPPLETHIHAPADLEMAPEPAPDPHTLPPPVVAAAVSRAAVPDVTVNPPEPPSARPTKIARRSREHASATVYVPNIDDILAPPAPLGSANWLEFYVPTLQAIAAHHNAAKARWKTPGKWMGDDLAEFDPDQAPAVAAMFWNLNTRQMRSGAIFSAWTGAINFAPLLSQAVAAECDNQEGHEPDEDLTDIDEEWPPNPLNHGRRSIRFDDLPPAPSPRKRRASPSSDDVVAASSAQTGAHRRRKVKRQRLIEEEGYIARPSVLRKHIQSAEPVHRSFLRHRQACRRSGRLLGEGLLSSEDKSEKYGRKKCRSLAELVGLGTPHPLVDSEGRTSLVLVGQPDDNHYRAPAHSFIKQEGLPPVQSQRSSLPVNKSDGSLNSTVLNPLGHPELIEYLKGASAPVPGMAGLVLSGLSAWTACVDTNSVSPLSRAGIYHPL